MDLSHIFYKELLADDDDIFSAKLAENNKIEEVSLKKDKKYMVTGLSINQKTYIDIIIPDLSARNSLSNTIRSYEEERKKIKLKCHLCKPDLFDITVSFMNRRAV